MVTVLIQVNRTLSDIPRSCLSPPWLFNDFIITCSMVRSVERPPHTRLSARICCTFNCSWCICTCIFICSCCNCTVVAYSFAAAGFAVPFHVARARACVAGPHQRAQDPPSCNKQSMVQYRVVQRNHASGNSTGNYEVNNKPVCTTHKIRWNVMQGSDTTLIPILSHPRRQV